ncbi:MULTISPECIES: HAD family hydrolase [Rhizobium]|uniref:HAD family hydrolase n=2 Tax=Rhizobium TaxID=379 RepID=A0A387G7Y2_9HYPH|nr:MULTISPECIES: HAD-IA family hydrolase [Rhizobium]AYG63972.1 HAD family hydrolase [Rhizobium jaguaris]MDL2402909.1 HAD-IA family hydrolase [Rhizobium mayense]
MTSCKTPKLLIFDCDGVLIDSEIIATAVHVEALAGHGYNITADTYNSRFIGMTDRQTYSIIEAESGLRLPEGHHESVMAEIGKRYASDLKAISGVNQALEAINAERCVASSSDLKKLHFALKLTDLYDYFSPYVFSASQVACGKPAPDLFLFASERMDTSADDCLVIEDSVAGVQAAVAARMRVIGFVGGSHCPFEHANKLLEAGAMRTFSQMTALPEILAG